MTMVQSRMSRFSTSAGVVDVAAQNAPAATKPLRQQSHHHHNTAVLPSAEQNHDHNCDHGEFVGDGPPAKKRKLSLRHKQQTTLDQFTVAAVTQSDAPKPPNSVTEVRPHGQLVETVNGVRTALDVDLDHIAGQHPTNGTIATPQRSTTPQPQPPPPTSLSPPPPAPAAAAAASAATSGVAPEKKKEEKRTLRSQDDGPRLKSELATYFANYEDIVFDLQQEEDLVTVDTALYVTDDAAKHHPRSRGSASPSPRAAKASNGETEVETNSILATPEFGEFNGCPVIDLSVLTSDTLSHPSDPLDDAHFHKSHRRAERREKQLRNIEKERAMHEKVQLERLLDGLLGHDWLKVLGVTGITDGEAKKYEPKRDYFVAEVRILVAKFKLWKEQEKRQRLEKEAAFIAAREAEGSTAGETGEEEGSVEPPSSEKNASAARQLQEETTNSVRSGFKIKLGRRSLHPASNGATPTSAPHHNHSMPPPPHTAPNLLHLPTLPQPHQPITSFYTKRHLRDAALSKTRHPGSRNATAFGHPVPEIAEREFVLPGEYVTEEALRASARQRRRRKRASVADAASGS
ncbi:hypothetical protein LTR91_000097 [Friedmanniomyces endolithicus]|uniref:Something about silencing protein 4 domain-containing protein n=1 Tax=Friedmanniomyces endolithicus TaxID=329885 RepID=A0A4U0UYD0_9PEZI|nr:hypothetical protein LTS09_001113 [Friedmanniomyces endolithicus]KAK0298017.1 hypothetical protein LTS00_003556 [Friedmanniomyces endolithicus]KAK0310107.1 hypothetical protein LTR01_004306 [Friedmanniomyces endolithicus]KAK0322618.1 hypothetical protein LTR82_006578 [Friedmanniomyces endolithicus]KAK0826340.1 hypothetical protein LTR73_006204 [Friedmanniomyces endolithicus]